MSKTDVGAQEAQRGRQDRGDVVGWPLVWLRITIAVDVTIRLVVLSTLIYFLVRLWPASGIVVVIVAPAISYTLWHVTVLVPETPLLFKRWPSSSSARESVAVVGLLGLPRLFWAVLIVVQPNGGSTWPFVAIATATLLVAVSALAIWVRLRPVRLATTSRY